VQSLLFISKTQISLSLILNTPKVIAIVVTYHPQLSELHTLLQATLPQVDSIIVIDNGSDEDSLKLTEFAKDHRLVLHCLGQNYGVATAQNKGIHLAKEHGAQYVVLFDQDSIPAPDMVAKLLEASMSKESAGIKVGAVGPFYEDPRRHVPSRPFVSLNGLRVSLQNNDGVENIIPVSYLIASGSLTSIATLDAVGLMQDDLFIDYVDIEWGLRARKLGFQCFGIGNALLQHSLGEQIRFILGKSYCFHSPLRHYYQFRNGIWFYRQPYLSVSERVGGYSRLIKRFIACALFAGPHHENLYMMVKGLVHGMTGRLGKH
jgi:rhamnosyltransferase